MAEKSQVAYELGTNATFQGRIAGFANGKAHQILTQTAPHATPSAEETSWAQSIVGDLIGVSDLLRMTVAIQAPSDVEAALALTDTQLQPSVDAAFPIVIATRTANGTLKADDPAPAGGAAR